MKPSTERARRLRDPRLHHHRRERLASEQDPRDATHPRSPGSCAYARAPAGGRARNAGPCAWSPPAGCSAGPSAPRCAPAARWPWPSCSNRHTEATAHGGAELTRGGRSATDRPPRCVVREPPVPRGYRQRGGPARLLTPAQPGCRDAVVCARCGAVGRGDRRPPGPAPWRTAAVTTSARLRARQPQGDRGPARLRLVVTPARPGGRAALRPPPRPPPSASSSGRNPGSHSSSSSRSRTVAPSWHSTPIVLSVTRWISRYDGRQVELLAQLVGGGAGVGDPGRLAAHPAAG